MVPGATKMLTFVLPTGRVLQDAIALIGAAGLPANGLSSIGRRLVVVEGEFRYILAKPTDVPVYIVAGTADLGLAGSDVLMEMSAPVVELADTRTGIWRMVLAAPKDRPLQGDFSDGAAKTAAGIPWIRVATK